MITSLRRDANVVASLVIGLWCGAAFLLPVFAQQGSSLPEVKQVKQIPPVPLRPPEGSSTVEGYATDAETRRGLSGVPVLLSIPTQERCGEAITDASGYYAFRGIAEGQYVVEIQPSAAYAIHPDKRQQTGGVAARGTLRLDWAIFRALTVRGILIAANGQPAAGYAIGYGIGNGDIGKLITDAQGRFEMPGIPPQSRLLFSTDRLDEILVRGQEWRVGDEPGDAVVVRLCKAASIAGVVLGLDGGPISRAEIGWHSLTRYANASGGGLANEKGEFLLTGLYDGRYELSAKPGADSGRMQRIFTFDLGAGEERADVVLLYNPAMDLSIRGRILDSEGNPLDGATQYWTTRDRSFSEYVKTQSDGTFSLSDLLPRDYYAAVIEYRGNTYYDWEGPRGDPIAAGTAGVDFRIKLESPRDVLQHLSGRVVAAESRAPIPHFEYVISEGVTSLMTERDFTVTSILEGTNIMRANNDSNGQFAMEVYRAGKYSLAIRAPGRALWLDVVNASADGVEIRLEPEAFVYGRAADAEGNPIAGAFVMYHSIFGYRMPDPSEPAVLARTDADGYFDIGGLPARELPLMLVHSDYADTRVMVLPQRENLAEVNVVMGAAGIVQGTVYLDGKPCSSGIVDWWNEATNPGYSLGGPMSDAGKFRINRLTPGDATLKVTIYSSDQSQSQEERVPLSIFGGQTLVHDFHFTSSGFEPIQ